MRLLIACLLVLLTACSESLNSPYPAGQSSRSILHSAFGERPKHLDPARSYSENEALFLGSIYEPPLQYHYLKRPYQLEPLTLTAMPEVHYFDARGHEVTAETSNPAWSEYTLRLKPGIRYQPHPALARRADGSLRYVPIDSAELAGIDRFEQFAETGSRELDAADYVYQIRRLADPRVQSPLYGFMVDYIVGLKELSQAIGAAAKKAPKGSYIDLTQFPFEGAQVIDRTTWRIRVKGRYPQFVYWLAMSFFAPAPEEAERFYRQPGMAEKNFTLDWQPLGTGPYFLAENQPNRIMRLKRNPHYHEDFFPSEGEAGDRAAGYLADAGRRLPIIDEAIFTLEKEGAPYWNKFLQGYYDASGLSSDAFDQAIRLGEDGTPDLTAEMKNRDIHLSTSIQPSNWYLGFNMLDPVVGGNSERTRKLRQAIAIAIDSEEMISIFLNGRGIPSHGPIPPGITGYLDGQEGINPLVYRWQEGRAQRRDLAEARRLLAEAGYPNGRDIRSGQPLTLYFDTMDSGPEAKSRLDWYRKQFAKLDIQLVIRSTDYNRFQDKMLKGSEQIFEWGWNADYPDPENFLFLLYGPNRKAGNGGENAANYQNAEFDRLFERMKNLPNGPERATLLARMVKIVREDAPWVFVYFQKSYGLRHDWLVPLKPNPMARNLLKYRRLDPAARVAYQQRWNQPVLWPLLATVGVLAALIWPAVRAYRRRLKATGHA